MREFGSELDEVVGRVERPSSFSPSAYYNRIGDCVEFIASPDRFYAERIDDLVTVYYSYETREIVGLLIKGIRGLCQQLTERCPGFAIEVQDGKVRLSHLLLARIWASDIKQEKTVRIRTYRKLVKVAEEADVDTELCAVG